MKNTKTFTTQGSHLEVRMAFIRTDYSCSEHRSKMNFFNDDPVLFQTASGEVDQFAQASFVMFGFDEPIDGAALALRGPSASSRLCTDLDDDGLRANIEEVIAESFVKDATVASAIADAIIGYWGFDGDFDELEEEVLQKLGDKDFEWSGEGAAESLDIEDDRCAGGILLEFALSSDLPADVNPDGTIEVSDELDWDEHRRERCIVWIKPPAGFGLWPAKT